MLLVRCCWDEDGESKGKAKARASTDTLVPLPNNRDGTFCGLIKNGPKFLLLSVIMLTIRSQIIHSKSCCFDEDDPLNWPGMGLAGHEVPQTSWSQLFVVKTIFLSFWSCLPLWVCGNTSFQFGF